MSKKKETIEDWNDIEEVNLSKKRYVADEIIDGLIESSKETRFKSLGQDEWIKRFKQFHGDTYDYSKVKFVRSDKPVIVICKEHGEFSIRAHTHANGGYCPICLRKRRQQQNEGNAGSNNSRWKDIDLEEVKRLRLSGMSIDKIAVHFNCSSNVIRLRMKIIKEQGL